MKNLVRVEHRLENSRVRLLITIFQPFDSVINTVAIFWIVINAKPIFSDIGSDMRIHQISGPRNISTALMYSFAQRPDTLVVDEPFYAYYLASNPNVDHPGREEVLLSLPVDWQGVIDGIILKDYSSEHVFFKNMAHHLEGVELRFMHDCANLLLIRHPLDLLISLSKVLENPSLRETGIAQTRHYFELLSTIQEIQPCIVHSEKLLQNPSAYLLAICEQLGIPFYKQMLSWKAGERKEDGIWAKYWYEAVHKSTGFQKPKESQHKALPSFLKPVYDEALEHYLHLEKYSLKI